MYSGLLKVDTPKVDTLFNILRNSRLPKVDTFLNDEKNTLYKII